MAKKNLSVPERKRQAIRRLAFTMSQIAEGGITLSGVSRLAALAIKETAEILRDEKNMYGTERKEFKAMGFAPSVISDALVALKEKK